MRARAYTHSSLTERTSARGRVGRGGRVWKRSDANDGRDDGTNRDGHARHGHAEHAGHGHLASHGASQLDDGPALYLQDGKVSGWDEDHLQLRRPDGL